MPPGLYSTDGFGIMGTANDTTVGPIERFKFIFVLQVEKEELIYPLQSLVAEVGGALGLFLGFSFIAIWDSLVSFNGS